MYTTKKLLSEVKKRVKKEYGKATVYRLAKVVGVSRRTIDNWEMGRTMDDENAVKIALFLGLDPEYILACITAERCENTAAAEVWRGIVQRLEHPIAASLAAFVVIAAALPGLPL